MSSDLMTAETIRPVLARRLGVLAVLCAAVLAPFVLAPYAVGQLTMLLVMAMAVLGLNLFTGYCGMLSLGHGAFLAVGAYLCAILLLEGVSTPIAVVVSAATTALLGYLLGIPTLRLRGIYLALVTIALAIITPPLIKRFDGLTGGAMGLVVPTPAPPSWSGLAQDQWIYLLTLAVASLLFLIASNLVSSRVGRTIRSIKDNELVAQSMGVNLATSKTVMFALSAGFAGVAGAMYTLAIGFVSPESFTFLLSVSLVAAMVIGGSQSIVGALIGAAFIQYVPDWTAEIDVALSGLLYGAALVVAMLVMPGGAVELIRRTTRWVTARSRRTGPTPTEPALAPPSASTDPTDLSVDRKETGAR